MLAPAGREDGQIGLYILGACVLILTMVIGIVDVTAVQLARIRLYDVADAAALDAADAVHESALYARGLDSHLPVSSESVHAQATRFVGATKRPAGVRSWTVASGTGSKDGRQATVVLTGTVEMPLGGALLASVMGPVTITVTSQAQGRVDGVDAVVAP
ncbi:hypothetical protein KEM60_03158 [Austwickia sp. TVS 96-490-7B]|nr:hypothetical protein [Austwickia sp. TVS 96-490-7B]